MAVANSNALKLSFHKGSGQYCKVVNGKRYYLGKDEGQALETWIKYRADFQRGIDPRKSKTGTTRYLSLRDGCNLFLDRRKDEIADATWKSLRFQAKQLVEFFGPTTQFSSLTPDHFAALRDHLDKGSPVSLGNKIVRVKTIFGWLADRDYIAKPDFGIDFRPPNKKQVRKHRRQQAERVLCPDEFRKITNALGVQMRACAYLGLNCGFGPTDCFELPREVVDFENAVIHWARVKSEVDRICPLWAETVEALELWERCRDDQGSKKFFEFNQADNVSREFHEGVKGAGRKRNGLSFYSLRHTLATIGRGARDDDALKIIMGHTPDDILGEHYTHEFPRERLDDVSEHVRQWLLGTASRRRPR